MFLKQSFLYCGRIALTGSEPCGHQSMVVSKERTLGDFRIKRHLSTSTNQSSDYFHFLSNDVAFDHCASKISSEFSYQKILVEPIGSFNY